jgi:hypothetical protein
MAGQSYESTTYIKGKRQRTETMSGMMVNITQCDLRRGIQFNPQSRTYMVNPFSATSETGTQPASSAKNGATTTGGTITTTITTKDTGERKQMFGYTARHLIITMETISSPDACSRTNSKMQMDGWYIDAEFVLDCDTGMGGMGFGAKRGGCQDKYAMKQVGPAVKRGYPVYEKMSMFDEAGKETMSMINEVLELSKAVLEGGLFEVPEGYREVSDSSQLYAGIGSSSSAYSADADSTSGLSSTVSSVAQKPAEVSQPVGAKKPGIIRIGIAPVKTGQVGSSISAADLAMAVQNAFASYLKVPKVEVVTLDARLDSAVDSEAKQKECDYVIYATASHKKGGGGFGSMLGTSIGSAIGSTGIGHTGSTAGNIAGQIATQAIVASTVSANVKSKDEITLDLKLQPPGGSPMLGQQFKAKARSNGDDIISQAVEPAAQAVVNLVTK